MARWAGQLAADNAGLDPSLIAMPTDGSPPEPLIPAALGALRSFRWWARLDWAEGFDKDDPVAVQAWAQECMARDKRVGALLRELHYLCTSKPPWGLKGNDEDEYWTGYAGNCPTLSETKLQAEIDRRKAGR